MDDFNDEKRPEISLEEFEKELALNEIKKDEEVEGKDTSLKASSTMQTPANGNSRHSTGIYQMLERIENKVHYNY